MKQFTEEQTKRIKACQEAIDGVLDNYKCVMVPSLTIMQGQIVSHGIGIFPEKEEKRIIVPKVDTSKINLNKGGK